MCKEIELFQVLNSGGEPAGTYLNPSAIFTNKEDVQSYLEELNELAEDYEGFTISPVTIVVNSGSLVVPEYEGFY